MPRKSERTNYYEQMQDTRSHLFSDVDWSDEINHVRYGKRWLDWFLRDDACTIEDIQQEISEHLKTFQEQIPDGRDAPW